MMFQQVTRLSLAAALLSGCGGSSTEDDHTVTSVDAGSVHAGLAFTVTDYTSSALYYYDFATGAVDARLTGQSGDPWVKWLDGKLFFFNRKTDNLNVRTLDPRKTPEVAPPTAQVSTGGAGGGDPHDAQALGDGKVLLAQYNVGALVVIDGASGVATQTLDSTTLDFGEKAGADTQFRPESILSGNPNEIWVLHQGRDKNFKADGTQRLFKLAYAGGVLTAVDLDPAKEKVQGIPLLVGNASTLAFAGEGDPKINVGGLCSVYDGDACATTSSGVEQVDPTAKTSRMVLDLSKTAHRGNGPFVDAQFGVFLAMAATSGATGQPEKKYVLRLDVATAAVEEAHVFPADSAGCCALFADKNSPRFYVGDAAAGGRGKLTTYIGWPAPQATTVDLAGAPYTGWLVPK